MNKNLLPLYVCSYITVAGEVDVSSRQWCMLFPMNSCEELVATGMQTDGDTKAM